MGTTLLLLAGRAALARALVRETAAALWGATSITAAAEEVVGACTAHHREDRGCTHPETTETEEEEDMSAVPRAAKALTSVGLLLRVAADAFTRAVVIIAEREAITLVAMVAADIMVACAKRIFLGCYDAALVSWRYIFMELLWPSYYSRFGVLELKIWLLYNL